MGSKTATSSGTNNGTSTTTLAPNVQAAYNSLLSQFGGLSNTSTGTPAVTNAASGLTNLAANDNPAFGQAASDFSSSTNPAYNTVGNYLSPYLNDALSSQVALENQQNQQQQQGLIGNAIANGSFGGNRVGLAQSALAGQQQLANNATNSGLINTAYQQALTAAQTQQSAEQSAGTGLTNVGTSQNQASLSNLLGLLSAGQFQQTAPYQNLSTLSGAASGLSNAGATTTSTGNTTATVPNGNSISSLLGAGLGIAGLFKEGGHVRGYDAGGIVASMADERNAGLAGALQAAQAAIAPKNDNQANDNFTPSQGQMKQGVANIQGWFAPPTSLPVGVGETGGYGSSHARGGLVGYGPGGYVQPTRDDTFDIGSYLSSLFPPPAAPAPPDTGSALASFNRAPDLGLTGNALQTAALPAGAVADRAAQLRAVTGADQPTYVTTPPSGLVAAPNNVVPFTPPAAAAPTAPPPVPLAPLPPAMSAPPAAPVGLSAAVPAAPAAGLVAAPAQTGHVPLAIANNNQGDITASPWTAKQPGYVGTNGDFAVFSSPEAGRNAQISLLGTYAAGGNNTIAGMISKWAPQAANLKTPGSTQNYINYVSQKLGLPPNAPVPTSMLPAMADAMGEVESGRRSASTGSPATYGIAPPTGPSAVSDMPQPSGLVGGNMGEPSINAPVVSGVVQPPGGFGVPDSNAGYSTDIQDSIKSLLAGKGLNLSPDARMGLLSASAGMMAGTNPNALANIGTGIQQGLDTWSQKQALNRQNDLANSSIADQQGRLGLAGQSVQQAGQSLYQQVQQTKADIANLQANAGRTNVAAATERFVPSVAGMLQYDPDNPNAAPKLVPWSHFMGGPDGQGAPAEPVPDKDGFITTAPSGAPSPLVMSPTTAPLVIDQTKTLLGGAQGDAVNAQGLNAQISELANLAKGMPNSGLLSQGSGFNERVNAVKGINSIFQTMGWRPVYPDDVATAEGMKKLATQLQFSVADAVKNDPAASTIVQAASASPSGENTAQGFNRIISNIQALNKRSIDRYSFVQDWANKHYGDTSGADVAFNQANPPQKYVAYGEDLAKNLANPKGTQANPLVPTSQSDIDNAAPGTVFNVNGKMMVKK